MDQGALVRCVCNGVQQGKQVLTSVTRRGHGGRGACKDLPPPLPYSASLLWMGHCCSNAVVDGGWWRALDATLDMCVVHASKRACARMKRRVCISLTMKRLRLNRDRAGWRKRREWQAAWLVGECNQAPGWGHCQGATTARHVTSGGGVLQVAHHCIVSLSPPVTCWLIDFYVCVSARIAS